MRDGRVPALTGPGAVAFAQTAEDGSYRLDDVAPGDYYVRAYAGQGGPDTGGGAVYAPTFYPGVPLMVEAQPLRITPGRSFSTSTSPWPLRGPSPCPAP